MLAGKDFDVAARLQVVEEENAILRERLARLETSFGLSFVAPVEWRLTGSEQAVVGALLARDHCTKDALMAALYRDFGKDEPEIKIIDVFICKLRKKLKPFGLEITTIWGLGYAMSAAMKARARAMIAGEVVT